MASGRKLLKRAGCGLSAILLILGGWIMFTEQGRAVFELASDKRIRDAVTDALTETEKRKYNATTEANLKAIHTALMMYHDSEGQFPLAESWMDAIEGRLVTSDMEGSEAQKKLISPSLAGQPGQFGYALNDRASGKYKDDLDPKMPLVFDASDTKKNAHGDPRTLAPKPARGGRNMMITVDGTVLGL
jgi:hypothetical protein